MNKPIFSAFILFLISLASCKKEGNKTTGETKTRTRLISYQALYGANQIAVTHYFQYNSDNKLSTHIGEYPTDDTTNPVRHNTTKYFYGSNNRLSADETVQSDGNVFHGSYEYDDFDRLVSYQYKDDNGKLWVSIEYEYNTDFVEIRWKRDPNTNRVDTMKYHDDGMGNIGLLYEQNNHGEYKRSIYNITYDSHPSIFSSVIGLEILMFIENDPFRCLIMPKNNVTGYTQDFFINNNSATYKFEYLYNDEGYVTHRMLGGGLPLGGTDVFTYEKY